MSSSRTPAGALVIAVATVLAVLACLDTRVEAIVCYDCNSEYDPRCGDPFDPYTLGQIDCNDRPALEHLSGTNATLCRKLVQKIGERVRVIRTCGYIDEPIKDKSTCVSRSGTHDVNVLYCACKGNLCNAAPSLSRAAPAASLLLLLPLLRLVRS